MTPEYLDRLFTAVGNVRSLQPPPEGWLKTIRKAMHLTQQDVAKFFNVTSQAVAGYENNERNKTLTMSTLNDVAGALGCEVVYCLVPKNGRTFVQVEAAASTPSKPKSEDDKSK